MYWISNYTIPTFNFSNRIYKIKKNATNGKQEELTDTVKQPIGYV